MRDQCGVKMMLAELIVLTTQEANDTMVTTKHRTWKEAQIAAAKALKLPEITVPSLMTIILTVKLSIPYSCNTQKDQRQN